MFALYGNYGATAKKAVKKTAKKASKPFKTSAKPHPTKPGVKVTLTRTPATKAGDKFVKVLKDGKVYLKPNPMKVKKLEPKKTAVKAVKVLTKSPLTPKKAKAASAAAASKTIKNASQSLKKPLKAKSPALTKKAIQAPLTKTQEAVTQKILDKIKPQIIPEAPIQVKFPSVDTESNRPKVEPDFTKEDMQEEKQGKGKTVLIIASIGAAALLLMKKGKK